MTLPNTEDRVGSPRRIVRYFTLLMALVYVALGVALWYAATHPTPFDETLLRGLGPRGRYTLGAVLALYGLYRLISTLRTQFRNSPPDEIS